MSTENTLNTESAGSTGAESTSIAATTTQTTTPSAVQTPSAQTVGSLPTESQSSGAMATGTSQYTPNYKYRAALQEKELDAFWHPLIKDADSEKKVKEIFTRADAFDYMKEKLTKRDTDYESLAKDFETQARIVNKVREAQAKKDFDSVFRNIGLTDHDVIQWAAKKVDYLQMMNGLPPEQRQALEMQQQAALQNEYYQEQLNQMQSQYQVQATQAREVQLDMVLSRPEVNQAASFLDQKMGYLGAFRDEVIETAKNYWLSTKAQTGTGVDLSPEQAVQMVLQKFGKFMDIQNGQTQTVQQTQNTSTQTQGLQAQAAKPVIPAISGQAKTPIKKQFTSLEEIKKHAKELEKQQQF